MDVKPLYLLFSIVFLAAQVAYGDGLPVTPDKKSVVGAFTRIELDAEQITEVETQRKVVLRAAQMAKLTKVAGGPVGDITVYSSRYNMCTCFDHDVKAIWTQKGVLDFPHSSLFMNRQRKTAAKDQREETDSDAAEKAEDVHLVVVYDSDGEMYLDGKHLTLAQVESKIDILANTHPEDKTKKLYRIVIFDPPAPISEKTDQKVLASYKELKNYCELRGLTTQDWGIEQR